MPTHEPTERILIVSDLHFGKFFDPKFQNVETIAKQVIESLEDDRRRPDFILCPGDLTSCGHSKEFEDAKEFFRILLSHFKLSDADLLTLVGNHDVNRAIFTTLSDLPSESGICEATSKSLATQVQSCHYWHQFDKSGPCYGSGIVRRKHYNVIALNSSWNCIDEDARNGLVGARQIRWLQQLSGTIDSSIPTILALHHHPEIIPYPVEIEKFIPDRSQATDGAELLKVIEMLNIQLIIHGHRHHPALAQILTKGAEQRTIPVLCAGSLGVQGSKRLGDVPNFFHLIEYNPEGEYSDIFTYNSNPRGVWTSTFSAEIHRTISPMQAIPGKQYRQPQTEDYSKLIHKLHINRKKITFSSLPAKLRCLNRESLLNYFDRYAEGNNLETSGDYLNSKGMVFIDRSV